MRDEFAHLPDSMREDYGKAYFTKFFDRMAKFVSEFQNPQAEQVGI